jgi:pyruvate formate lyase activating enzyme
MANGMIFNILRYTLDDGPGTRSTVFMKGCPLRCAWCSNPESQNYHREVTHRDSFCQKCFKCVEVCEEKAIAVDEDGVYIDRKKCTNCGECVDVCPSTTLQFMGEEKSVDEVFKVLKKDISYYEVSDGGITVSGGEALSQPDFVEELFETCQDAGIHTCLDTSGYGDTSSLEKILAHTDLVYFDLKTVNPLVHQKYIGKSLELILKNLEVVAKSKTPLVIRIPLIPGVNDSDHDITKMAEKAAEIMKEGNLLAVHLLPYHRYGYSKYQALDREYGMSGTERPTDEQLQRAKGIIESFGMECEIRE